MMLEFAPIRQPKQSKRDAFLSPTGTYYTLTLPTEDAVPQLVEIGVNRIVVASSAQYDPAIIDLLLDAGIEVAFQQAA